MTDQRIASFLIATVLLAQAELGCGQFVIWVTDPMWHGFIRYAGSLDKPDEVFPMTGYGNAGFRILGEPASLIMSKHTRCACIKHSSLCKSPRQTERKLIL